MFACFILAISFFPDRQTHFDLDWVPSSEGGVTLLFFFLLSVSVVSIASVLWLVRFSIRRTRLWSRTRSILPEDRHAYASYLSAYQAAVENRRMAEEVAALERTRERRRRYEEYRRQLAWCQGLNGEQFERELTKLLNDNGYNAERTGGSGDEGIDIFATRNEQAIVIQCKAHMAYVGPGAVRELYGALIHQGAQEGWLVTTHGFTHGARDFARGKPIKLHTIQGILTVLSHQQQLGPL